MKKVFMLFVMALALAAFGCDVEQTGEDTYEVETPTDEAEAAADEVGEEFGEAAQATETALENAGEEIQEGTREAGQETGAALEEAGEEMQEHSQPGDQD